MSGKAITHIVMFEFNSLASSADIENVCNEMLALKDKCVDPNTGKPYITSGSGGHDMSPEGLQGGLTHVFVFVFSNQKDRDYYIDRDPAHKKFQKLLEGLVKAVRVVDFVAGQF